MTTILAQQAVAEFHREMLHHHGEDMFIFHRNWHQNNKPPQLPATRPDPDWGTDAAFGTNFLQMHHEMVKAADDEQKFHMHHPSLVSWYASKGYDLPPEWDPRSPIPPLLAYTPDRSVFPPEIRQPLEESAGRAGRSPESLLKRRTDDPQFVLPNYFTRAGIASGEDKELYTGAKKLDDFKNVNQLGCCILFPHNAWHLAIDGAMANLATAIADPIFYFGVHWHIDKVFDEFKQILVERSNQPQDFVAAQPVGKHGPLPPFTEAQLRQRAADIALNERINRGLFWSR